MTDWEDKNTYHLNFTAVVTSAVINLLIFQIKQNSDTP